MEEKVSQMIQNENKYKPYTDSEIADYLGITREQVNDIRIKLGISNSRERLNNVLFNDAVDIYNSQKDISHRELMKKINMLGYSISRSKALSLLNDIKSSQKLNVKHNDTAVIADNCYDESDTDPFNKIIGFDGSMKLQIRQAQAAVLYPPRGLHSLLLGPSGVGKSLLAELMYKFAISTANFKSKAPFIIFNCADYADNPQLLLSQLFGYVKGAFTGADKDKDGLVKKADNGILFLDEVHRLPHEGQEILFNILDKGCFRRLGETENTIKVNLMIIAATTESTESSLLLTFRRRIPMVIEIPPLSDRTYEERLEIINSFFHAEAKRIEKNLTVDKNALKALMIYDCKGNIGQLRSDIQVGCAKALLNALLQKSEMINIKLSDLSEHVREGILNMDRKDSQLGYLIRNPLVINIMGATNDTSNDDRYIMPNKIYQFIESRSEELEKQGLRNNEINLVITREIESELEYFADISSQQQINKVELKNLVGAPIIELVDECYQIAKKYFKSLKNNFYYSLAIHLSSTYKRLLKGKSISNPELRRIKEKYYKEYEIASIIGDIINSKLLIDLPEEEVGFIAMYIKKFSSTDQNLQKVNVIIFTHGKVGKAIVEVVNKLLNTKHAIGLEMSLEENPRDALDRAAELIKKTDQGKGTILMVDMGSLTTFGDVLTKKTGIPVHVIDQVDTLTALEVTRRAIIPESTINEITHGIRKNDYKSNNELNKPGNNNISLPKAIITVCITGEGSADKLKEYVEKVVFKVGVNITVMPIGIISPIHVDLRIKRIMNNYHVIAFVGTIDPEIRNVPFISMQSLFNYEGINRLNTIIKCNHPTKDRVIELIDKDLIFLDINMNTKDEVIDFIVKKTQQKGYVDEDFLLSVYKREAITPTYIKGGIAIPHGFPQYVTKPVISIVRLNQEVSWMGSGGEVKIVILIAYQKNSKKYFQDIYRILLNQEVLKQLKTLNDKTSIINLIKQHATL